MFGGLRENSIVYLLDKTGERPILYEGTVIKKLNPVTPIPFGLPETEVSYSVKVGESVHTLEKLPVNLNITDKNGMVVSDNRESMLAEVQAMERVSDSVLQTVPYHQGMKEACEEMYERLNPQIAKEKATEDRLTKLEGLIGNIGGTLNRMQDTLEALNKSTNKSKNQ